MSLFELEAVGGPWARRLATRRAGIDDLPWADVRAGVSVGECDRARLVWTRSSFSEYASAAAFAQIASALLAAAAPIDLVAAAGDFVVDEMLHAELAARVAMAFGGAVALEVDLERLAAPPTAATPLLRAAELIVRTSCVGEALTVPILKHARANAGSALVSDVIGRIVADESAHAELGGWFLDWADPRLSDDDRAHVGRVAGAALHAFAPIFSGECSGEIGLGSLDCASYDPTFAEAVARRVVAPLAERGIHVPEQDLAGLPRPVTAG